jgi:hypothetical protein
MLNGQLYLAHVSWRSRDVIEDLTPGKLSVRTALLQDENRFEASIPAYARENGRSMQLAIRSEHPCFIIQQADKHVPLTRFRHPDTGDLWWIEKGEWRSKGGYYDAPSFRHPGGHIDISIGGDVCRIHMYDPSISDNEFQALLDDIKSWCWKMAVDESCYVTVGQESEVRVLSAEFLRFADNFVRNISSALNALHCELREAVQPQRIDRLKPNGHSIRFLAQRGERDVVPGRASVAHYDTPENRFLHGMLKAVLRMLQPQGTLARESANRFISTAKHYEDRAIELRTKTTETIDPDVFDENLRRSQAGRDAGFDKLKITNKIGIGGERWRIAYDGGIWVLVKLPPRAGSPEIYEFLDQFASATIIGDLTFKEEKRENRTFWSCDIKRIDAIQQWRDYKKECKALEDERKELETSNWERQLPASVISERKKEAETLEARAKALRSAAHNTHDNCALLQSLIDKAFEADRILTSLGCKPDLRFVPTMVFLQSPAYSGTLSSYRQLRDLTGMDDDSLAVLLELEEVGLRDWPGVYERWCLVSLLNVLQNDFGFKFNPVEVRANLLKYCTGTNSRAFFAQAFRNDIDLELTLHYQPKFENGRIPDFLLEICRRVNGRVVSSIRCVLDAKACNFVHRPANAKPNPWIYLDDCLHDLIGKKDYGEAGENLVFIMHACQNPITSSTTSQPWARASSYGGDAVYHWEVEGTAGLKKANHRHGAVMVRPHDTTHLKRLVLMLIQFHLDVMEICGSCGSGGQDIAVELQKTEGDNPKHLCKCRKCNFTSLKSLCYSCKEKLYKNQAFWSYHDSHPASPWNIKCWSCGTLL